MDWKKILRNSIQYHEELFYVPYRRQLEKDLRKEEDLFMLICFLDMLGIANPVSYYTLELLPEMYERFHEWHLRMGMEHSPLDDFRCC